MFSLSQLLDRAVQAAGNEIAVSDHLGHVTWLQLRRRVARLAGALSGLGLSPGDRVALLGANSALYFEFYFAAPWAGCIAVPINIRLAPPEIAALIQDSGTRVLLVEAAFTQLVSSIRAQLTSVEHIVVVGSEASLDGCLRLEELLAGASEREDFGRRDDDLALLLYTGGTTGRSKGVMLSHHGLILNTLQWICGLAVTREDSLLVAAPMFHGVAALNAIAAATLPARLCILPRFDPLMFLEYVERWRPTKTALVPTMLEMLLNEPSLAEFDLSSLTKISYGGSPIPARTLTRALDALPHIRFYQVYGQTEGGPTLTVLPSKYHDVTKGDRWRSAGQPVPLVDLRICDAEGTPLPARAVGEICVRSPALSPGYWNLPDVTAQSRRGDWLRTGDAGYVDEDGFLYIVDRVKDMIVTGGENVYAAEVENVLLAHPTVAGCAVIGIPHQRWGEQVHALVRPSPGAAPSADELLAYCRQHLAGYKCPRSVEFRETPFPMNAAGKILKRELRKAYWKDAQEPS